MQVSTSLQNIHVKQKGFHWIKYLAYKIKRNSEYYLACVPLSLSLYFVSIKAQIIMYGMRH